ncbi:MAG: leucine-rich repeat protein [Clostridia bacterium]|nr:leucine-rich repeat protein [Clostridia bacterium]
MKTLKKKQIIAFLVMVMFVMLSFSAYATESKITVTEYGYVSDGLVSYYKGSGNEGKTYWEDLAGDNDITGLTLDDTNKFTNKGLQITSTKQTLPTGIKNVLTGDSFTVEIYLSDFVNNSVSFNNILKCGEPFSFFVRNNEDTQYIEFKHIGGGAEGARHKVSISPAEDLKDGLLSLTYTVGGTTCLYLDGVLISEKTSALDNLDISSSPAIGEGVDAVYNSMRCYNRALSVEEIMINAAADVAKNEYGFAADGLVSYYEGSGNVDATEWKDLVGENHITAATDTLKGLTINDTNYFTEKGFAVNNTMQYLPSAIIDDVIATSAFTVEIHLSDFTPANQSWCHILKHDTDNFSFYIDSIGNELKFKNEADGSSGSRPTSTGMLDKLQDGLLTLTFAAGGKTAVYLNGELLSSATAATGNLNLDSTKGLFFGNGFAAVYESMRFYNRVLDPKEIMANAITEMELTETAPDPEPEPTPEIPYVTDGLVSYYEGTGNEGKTTWDDLVGDNDITNLKTDDNNYFTEEGFKIYTNVEKAGIMPDAIAALLEGDAFTFEIHISDLKDEGVDASHGYNDLLKHDANNFSFYRQFSSDTIYLKNNQDGSRPTASEALDTLQDAIITVTFAKGGKTAIYVNGELSTSVDASPSNIGLSTENGNNLYFGYNVNAVYKAMRFYNRVLTEDEIKANVEAAGMTPLPTYIDVAQPVTNIVGDISAIREVSSAAELSELLADSAMLPATAIFTADKSLNLLDENGNAFSTVSEIIAEMGYQIIPAFRVETEEAAVAVGTWLNENFTDAFIISSSPTVLAAGRTVAPLVGGVIDYSNTYALKTALTKDDCIAIRKEIFKNMATVAILPGGLCDADTVQYLYERQVGVWASISDEPTTAETFGAVNSGALGVISDDTALVLNTAINLPEMTMTRTPLNIAHMGFADTGIKRNHYSGIVYSYEKGGKTIEFDVYLTAEDTDGSRQLIINHDATITATDGNTYTIAETPWSTLKELKTASGDYEFDISTVESVFEYFKDKEDAILLPELKAASDISVVEEIWKLIEKYGLYDNVVGLTFSTDFIAKSREICPELPFVKVGYNSPVFEGNTDGGILGVKKLVGELNAIYDASVGDTVAHGSARAMLKRGMLLYAFDNTTAKIPWYFMTGTSSISNDWVDGNIINYPLNINVMGAADGEYVVPGKTLSLSAVVDSYRYLDTSVTDFTVEILAGADLVTVSGADLTFGETAGKVTFVLSYTKTIPQRIDSEVETYPEMEYTVYSDPITVIITDFDGSVKTEGYSIKLKPTKTAENGLRSIFSFDNNKNAFFVDQGYELLEYGAVAVSEARYILDGSVVTISSQADAEGNYQLETGGQKVVVWKNNEPVGKTLGTKDGIVYYCLAVTNYTKNHSDNVYFCAYSIYEDPNGKIIVTTKDYGIDGYNAVNLYQTTLDMYINGAINSSNTHDTAVWNTLLTGAVTLTESDYRADQVYKLDADGNATTEYYSGDFEFKEIPLWMKKSVNNDIKLTLLNNPNNTADTSDDTWVAVYRGSGSLISNYDNRTYSQLSACEGDVIGNISASGLAASSPRLLPESTNKIRTVIMDDGITGFGDYVWFRVYKIETVVYPKSVTTVAASAFYYVQNLKTVYRANATGEMQNNTEGLVDLSNVESVNTAALLRNSFGMSAVHLPRNITTIDTKFREENYSNNLTKIWCGDTAMPADGIIDLTGAVNLTKFGNNSLNNMPKITVVKLPDSCTSFGTDVFKNTPITEIWQATYNADVAAYCETNGLKYYDMKGNEQVDPLSIPGDVEAGESAVWPES